MHFVLVYMQFGDGNQIYEGLEPSVQCPQIKCADRSKHIIIMVIDHWKRSL